MPPGDPARGATIRVATPPPPTTPPAAAIATWPPGTPLAVLWSPRAVVLARPLETRRAQTPTAALDLLASLGSPARQGPTPAEPPHDPPEPVPGWIGWVSYDLGRAIEPAAAHPGAPGPDRPHALAEFHRVEAAHVFDRSTGRWRVAGDPAGLPDLAEITGGPPTPTRPWSLGALTPETRRDAFLDRVARVLAYIRAGDVYQVNLAHRLSAPFEGSARGLFARLAAAADPRHGVYTESTPDARTRTALCSISPELFLNFDPVTRRLTTRPMKGTRPASAPVEDLLHAPKDRAELAMIVDLMRNDLGRVCELGSVRVERPRDIERHAASVLQATATITGTARANASLAEVARAAFPPGSVTGAPKIRAMQIIDELESARRGPYCGCAGVITDAGAWSLNVSIRTAVITGRPATGGLDAIDAGTLDYPVGAGIVADSDPGAEWDETLLKADAVHRALASGSPEDSSAIAPQQPAGA